MLQFAQNESQRLREQLVFLSFAIWLIQKCYELEESAMLGSGNYDEAKSKRIEHLQATIQTLSQQLEQQQSEMIVDSASSTQVEVPSKFDEAVRALETVQHLQQGTSEFKAKADG
jgi:hypothetical protein